MSLYYSEEIQISFKYVKFEGNALTRSTPIFLRHLRGIFFVSALWKFLDRTGRIPARSLQPQKESSS